MPYVLTYFFPFAKFLHYFSLFFPLYFIYTFFKILFFSSSCALCKYMYVLHSLFSVKGKFSRIGYFSEGYKIKFCKSFLSVRCWFSKFRFAYCCDNRCSNPLQIRMLRFWPKKTLQKAASDMYVHFDGFLLHPMRGGTFKKLPNESKGNYEEGK